MIYRCIKSNAVANEKSFIILERGMTVRNREIVYSTIELKDSDQQLTLGDVNLRLNK